MGNLVAYDFVNVFRALLKVLEAQAITIFKYLVDALLNDCALIEILDHRLSPMRGFRVFGSVHIRVNCIFEEV